ncbi:MAG: hypothetical protein F4Y16_02445 [Holophagales bacterium]|nr:hypothetical protein [Holophagales bacterium]MYH26653.1 hypothetical protein [Holophagales bacterium]
MSRALLCAAVLWCAALIAGAATAQGCPGPELHGLFPQDIYVFRGFVTEAAALPLGDDGAFQLEVQVEEAVHLPRSRSRYAVTVETTEENCAKRPLTARELRDRFAVGDEVKIVAHEEPGSTRSLVAPYHRVALVMAEAGESDLIKNDFDYYDALLELDARFADTDKFSLVSQMGRYLASRDDFRRLLEEQIQERRYRRQLLDLYDALREP